MENSLDRDLIPEFKSILDNLLRELKQIISKSNTSKIIKEKISNDKENELIEQLKHSLSKRQSKDCIKMLDKFDNYVVTEELEDKLKDIRTLIENRKYRDALGVLNEK